MKGRPAMDAPVNAAPLTATKTRLPIRTGSLRIMPLPLRFCGVRLFIK
jgi:hypothetical protein